MRISRGMGGVVSVLPLLLCVPTPVSADEPGVRDFGIACTQSAFIACASVKAWNEVDAGTGERYLFVELANVQGWAGFEDLVRSGLGRWSLTNLVLDNYTEIPGYELHWRVDDWSTFGIGGPGTFLCGGGTCNAGPVGLGKEFAISSSEPITLTSSLYSDSEYLLWGCDVPGAGDPYDWGAWSSCTGTAIYRISLGFQAGLLLTDDTHLELAFSTYDAQHDLHDASCSTDPTSPTPCTVVPEPITMVLLGSGLLGVGGAGMARRRRREDDVEADAADA